MEIPSWAGSVALHTGGIAALLLLQQHETLTVTPVLVTLDIAVPRKVAAPVAPRAVGGGGGGNDVRRAERGRLPRVAELVFTPPTTKVAEIEPALPMEATIVAAPAVDIAALRIGDPFGVPGPPSDGPGKRGGIGGGDGGGVGDRKGPRAGDGPGVSGAYSIGAVSSPPVLIHKVEPEFSEAARKARFNGTVVLRVVIDENGTPTRIEVLRTPGLGLDERAVASVAQWRFRPGRKEGKAVPVWATVEVNFSLL
jgi:TonB family protein